VSFHYALQPALEAAEAREREALGALTRARRAAQAAAAALEHIAPERLLLAPDCGMKYLPRDVAFAKLRALVDGTKIVRRELGIAD